MASLSSARRSVSSSRASSSSKSKGKLPTPRVPGRMLNQSVGSFLPTDCMYPLISSTLLDILYRERVEQHAKVLEHRPPVRSLALALGHTFIAIGNGLEHLGQ